MHTCISSHGLKRSWRSCPRRVNAGNKNTPSTHHPRRRNVTTLMVGLKKRSHTRKSHPKLVNLRDIAGERRRRRPVVTSDWRALRNVQTAMFSGVLRHVNTIIHSGHYNPCDPASSAPVPACQSRARIHDFLLSRVSASKNPHVPVAWHWP